MRDAERVREGLAEDERPRRRRVARRAFLEERRTPRRAGRGGRVDVPREAHRREVRREPRGVRGDGLVAAAVDGRQRLRRDHAHPGDELLDRQQRHEQRGEGRDGPPPPRPQVRPAPDGRERVGPRHARAGEGQRAARREVEQRLARLRRPRARSRDLEAARRVDEHLGADLERGLERDRRRGATRIDGRAHLLHAAQRRQRCHAARQEGRADRGVHAFGLSPDCQDVDFTVPTMHRDLSGSRRGEARSIVAAETNAVFRPRRWSLLGLSRDAGRARRGDGALPTRRAPRGSSRTSPCWS